MKPTASRFHQVFGGIGRDGVLHQALHAAPYLHRNVGVVGIVRRDALRRGQTRGQVQVLRVDRLDGGAPAERVIGLQERVVDGPGIKPRGTCFSTDCTSLRLSGSSCQSGTRCPRWPMWIDSRLPAWIS